MFSGMCARRLTGGARRESESASYSPTSRVCRVFGFLIFHSLEETTQLSEKTTEGQGGEDGLVWSGLC